MLGSVSIRVKVWFCPWPEVVNVGDVDRERLRQSAMLVAGRILGDGHVVRTQFFAADSGGPDETTVP